VTLNQDESASLRAGETLAPVPVNDLRRFAAANAARLANVARRVIASGWYTMGPETEAFEAVFARLCAAPSCVAVANGTDALEIGLRSLGCRPGDEVIVTANAGMYATTACLAIGAVPVFADVDSETLLISTESAADLVTARTRVVVVTHLYGNVVPIPELRAALPASVMILEDGAQAHGAAFDGRPVGALGDAAAFSFYPTKNLGALGDAGAIVCRDPETERHARVLRQYGWERRYVASEAGGRNSRMDEMQAAMLCELLHDLEARNRRRAAIWSHYTAALSRRVPFVDMHRSGVVAAPHLCVMRSERREQFIGDLAAVGVGTAVHYPVPDHRQRALADAPFRHGDLRTSERACREVVSLPLFPELRDDELERVVAAVDRFA
jgi:dTDP-3-amino-2,3,6-trideoxy-4-keto-D-glucose/dTDP-3-amino-3,4,6-trideoxy-alpha-D-glucose/dTDP-2,6-dideoxy-D-kanosamine transaminase